MPDTGAPYNLPYPLDSDPADVPADMQALADSTHTALAGVVVAGMSNLTFDANGSSTLSWGLSFTPTAVLLQYEAPIGTNTPIALYIRDNSITAAEVIIQATRPSDRFSGELKIHWVALP